VTTNRVENIDDEYDRAQRDADEDYEAWKAAREKARQQGAAGNWAEENRLYVASLVSERRADRAWLRCKQHGVA